jgi:hypothetical protein
MAALQCYNHSLLHNGIEMTKAAALLDRYFVSEGRSFSVESYAS